MITLWINGWKMKIWRIFGAATHKDTARQTSWNLGIGVSIAKLEKGHQFFYFSKR